MSNTTEHTVGHTPGPWETRGVDVIGKDAFGTALIAIAKGGVSINPEANSRLIAAAPEMLEALREIHKLWCCPEPKTKADWSARCDVMADFARAAIAKATNG